MTLSSQKRDQFSRYAQGGLCKSHRKFVILRNIYVQRVNFLNLNFGSKLFQYELSRKKLDRISLFLLAIDKYSVTPLFFKTSSITEDCYFWNICASVRLYTAVKASVFLCTTLQV